MKPDIEKNVSTTFPHVGKSFFFCPLNFFSQFATNTSGSNVNGILHQIDYEISIAQQDLAFNCRETAMIFMPPKPPKSTRQRRGATMGLVALSAVGILGGGLFVGGFDSCGLRGIFGNCQDQS